MDFTIEIWVNQGGLSGVKRMDGVVNLFFASGAKARHLEAQTARLKPCPFKNNPGIPSCGEKHGRASFIYHLAKGARMRMIFRLKYISLIICLLVALGSSSFAQSGAVLQNVLRPPKGVKVAIVVFEDLQCPDCANAAPLLEEASRTYKIPVVRHDFPLPKHNWSYEAAILARYFDTQSKKLGNDFRDKVFEHQSEITPDSLRSFAEKFASEHKVDLPFAVD